MSNIKNRIISSKEDENSYNIFIEEIVYSTKQKRYLNLWIWKDKRGISFRVDGDKEGAKIGEHFFLSKECAKKIKSELAFLGL